MIRRATGRPVVRLKRTIPAPPAAVFRAWLAPEVLCQWLAPGELTVTRVEVDERVGGKYQVWQGIGDGEVGGFESEIIELVPDERLVLRWGFVGPERRDGPMFDSIVTVMFAAAPNGATVLTLVHERLEALYEEMPDVAGNVGTGWDLVLTKLTATLSTPSEPV